MDAVVVPGSFPDLLGRLLLATLFGALIGLNREREGKPAGLRTVGEQIDRWLHRDPPKP